MSPFRYLPVSHRPPKPPCILFLAISLSFSLELFSHARAHVAGQEREPVLHQPGERGGQSRRGMNEKCQKTGLGGALRRRFQLVLLLPGSFNLLDEVAHRRSCTYIVLPLVLYFTVS
jgi:hypothetical protein